MSSQSIKAFLTNTLQVRSAAASVIQYAYRSYRERVANSSLNLGISTWQQLMKRSVQAELILNLQFQVPPIKPFGPDRFAHVLERRLADCPGDEQLHRTFIWKVRFQPDESVEYFFHQDMVETIEQAAIQDYGRQHLHACRVAIQRCVSHTSFSVFILVIILCNCVTLITSLELPEYSDVWVDLDILFFCIYFIEAAAKIISHGCCSLIPPKGYFTNGWNILDFIVVLEGLISLILYFSLKDGDLDVTTLSVFRAIRLLRPLRLITAVGSLRLMFGAIVRSAALVGTALMVIFFALYILAVPGLGTLQGTFRQRCMWNDTGLLALNESSLNHQNDDAALFLCAQPSTIGSPQTCDALVDDALDVNATELKAMLQCRLWQNNPGNGALNFDNILTSLLAVFMCSTMEGWADILQYSIQTSGYLYVLEMRDWLTGGDHFAGCATADRRSAVPN